MRRAGLGLFGVTALIVAVGSIGGCAPVKPYQREKLAERCMAPGFGDPLALQFRSHGEGSRQGSEGGYTTSGGGCGCN